MPVPDFQDGVAPSIAQLDAWLTQQVISTVTSATRPAGDEGQFCYETDTNRLIHYNGSGWLVWDLWDDRSYTPTLSASTTPPALGSTGTISGLWKREGRFASVRLTFQFGGSGISAGSGTYYITLPTTYRSTWGTSHVGWWRIVDSGTRTAPAIAELSNLSGGTNAVLGSLTSTGAVVTHAAPMAWGDTDTALITVRYPIGDADLYD